MQAIFLDCLVSILPSNIIAMDKPLNCTIKNPVNLTLGDIKVDMLCGCKVVDITFPNIMSPERGVVKVGEIRFKNFYVATLTVKAKYRTENTPRHTGDQPKWKTCLKRVKLMPDPHSEAGSHDYISLTSRQFRCELSNITGLRLILHQPSPVWREFKLEELRLFRSAGGPKTSPLPTWLLEEPKAKVQKKTVQRVASSTPKGGEGGVPDLDGLSANLQQLWALAEEVSTSQTSQSLGRFEVDGCYDINLLAYT
ncbi:nicolin-1-like isoform X2 [Littorina saxatilis]|uniref:nicolin-1-like isoform X2 n=1 Tax=Littorina saxatilis TaxID=31220 RepID=UPI0038B6A022